MYVRSQLFSRVIVYLMKNRNLHDSQHSLCAVDICSDIIHSRHEMQYRAREINKLVICIVYYLYIEGRIFGDIYFGVLEPITKID